MIKSRKPTDFAPTMGCQIKCEVEVVTSSGVPESKQLQIAYFICYGEQTMSELGIEDEATSGQFSEGKR